ncbi:MAG: SpoIIE family protein phosphatase [Firmicutes bacterium]|nr:SpoIIE family protein phosphatase [Bacillota bacterium]
MLHYKNISVTVMGRNILYAAALPVAALLAALFFDIGYQFVVVILETVLLLIWSMLYQMGADALWQRKTSGLLMSEEEGVAAVSICLGTFLAVIPWDEVWKGALLFCVMICAYGRGLSYALLVGLPAAAVLRMMNVSSESFMILCAVVAILCCFFRELSKGAAALGATVGGMMLLLLYQGQVILWEMVMLLSAGLAFIILPEKWYERYIWATPLQEASGAGAVRTMQQHVNRMLSRSAASMEEMGDLLRECNREKSLNSLDTSRIIEDLSQRVCDGCHFHSVCWGGSFSETYETIAAIMEAGRSKGIIEKKDIPLYFLNRCRNSDEFIKRTNRHYELYRLNLSWENRMRRSAMISAEQMHSMADMLQNMRNYLCAQLELDQNLSTRLQEELGRANVPVQRTQVLKDLKTDRYTLNVQVNTGHSQKLKNQLEARISSLLGIPVQVTDTRMIKQGLWDWKMEEVCRLRVEGSMVCKGKERINGDSTWMGRLPGGRYVAAISDGMGIGCRAGGESERALHLLRLLLNAGAEEAEAIRLLNSMLLLCGDGEHFSTIDMVVLNLYSGSVHIAKAGSAATILKRQGRIQIYRSDNVPVGIVEKAEWEAFQDQVGEGDWIVLASDGVFDQSCGSEAVERKIRSVMLQEGNCNSQGMAQRIFDTVKSEENEDDMTIIAMKIDQI